MYRVILDTNVVITALHKPNTALILSLALNGQLFICAPGRAHTKEKA